MILATFRTSMRAASLMEDLAAAGIKTTLEKPKWRIKRLPPPPFEVVISEADWTKGAEILNALIKAKANEAKQ